MRETGIGRQQWIQYQTKELKIPPSVNGERALSLWMERKKER